MEIASVSIMGEKIPNGPASPTAFCCAPNAPESTDRMVSIFPVCDRLPWIAGRIPKSWPCWKVGTRNCKPFSLDTIWETKNQEYLTNAIKPRRLDFTETIWSDTLPTSNKLASGKAEQHRENAQQRKQNKNKHQSRTAGSKLRSRLNKIKGFHNAFVKRGFGDLHTHA